VHIGQDDMSALEARRLLGEDKIIGVTVSSVEEARVAVEHGADYLGIGTLYATNTKKNTKDIIGVNGIRKILRYLDGSAEGKKVKTVCIGGVNATNVQRIKHQLFAPTPKNTSPKTIDGVAVVSAIVGASDPRAASENLANLLRTPPPFKAKSSEPHFWLEKNDQEITSLLKSAIQATKRVKEIGPLSHNMTNLVVQNFAANVALSIGASPIMANYGEEAADLAALGGALVVNMGTVTPEGLENFGKAIKAYNAAGGPIVLDPVGAGATSIRRGALATLMSAGYFDLIKGNEKEIVAVARASGLSLSSSSSQQQRGVDSGSALFTLEQRAYIVSHLAARERNVVLMTGATDVISDGIRTYAISNGHEYLGRITGSGCTLGTTLSAYLAANPEDKLRAAVAGLLHYEIAAEWAAKKDDIVVGPGTFVPVFIDELYNFGVDYVDRKRLKLERRAKVKCLKDIPDAGLLKEL
jgi:thiamine-phosphate diphosphorylase/hydroxyethylthiazole kinase